MVKFSLLFFLMKMKSRFNEDNPSEPYTAGKI